MKTNKEIKRIISVQIIEEEAAEKSYPAVLDPQSKSESRLKYSFDALLVSTMNIYQVTQIDWKATATNSLCSRIRQNYTNGEFI